MAAIKYENCKVAKYHDFKVLQSPYFIPDAPQIEVCKYCHTRKKYKFTPEGRMVDEHAYFLDHIRAFAQPSSGDVEMMKVYTFCNPMKVKQDAEEALKEEKKAEFFAENDERFKFAIKKALENKDENER